MTWSTPSTLSDEELVARSKSGDAESFNQLVRRWERPIFVLAFRTLGREEDARDVTQETFLRAFRALPGFKGDAKFSSWLYRIALNLCRDWMRRDRRAPMVAIPEGVELHELAANKEEVVSVEDLAARAELTTAVKAAMDLLPVEQRTAIILKEYHGLTFQEIADVMNCPLSTAKTRLYQGLMLLRRHLAEQGKFDASASTAPHGRRARGES
jgi:RNA polymerase sigma-70 factor, ECF subfamily